MCIYIFIASDGLSPIGGVREAQWRVFVRAVRIIRREMVLYLKHSNGSKII
jgi:hypothetical protein